MSFIVLVLLHIGFSLPVDQKKNVSKIAFGSCTNQFNGNNPQLFYSIARYHPDLFIWLGDAVYADDLKWFSRIPAGDEKKWKAKYDTLKWSPEYRSLTQVAMITGTWDDHDFGTNNGGKSFQAKHLGKSLYLEFLDDGSIRNHEGLYHSFSFNNLKVILLDIRWFRDENNDQADDLGESQWSWLEEQLKTNEKVKIIANGLQVHTYDRYGPAEKWHEPSRKRLWDLIDRYHGVLLLSGDVHYAEIMKVGCSKHLIYEITSSGLAHTVWTTYGWLGWTVLNLFQPFNFNIGPKVMEKNFGSIEIDWQQETIHLFLKDSKGEILNSHSFPITDLHKTIEIDSICTAGRFNQKYHHIISSFTVIILPLLLNVSSLLIFLRKYSNSY
jgi:alkaline phosphatase D